MANAAGGDTMRFNVYRNPSYSTIWCDGIVAGGVRGGSVPPGNSSGTHTVCGRIGANQSTRKAGNFSVVLTVTMTFAP